MRPVDAEDTIAALATPSGEGGIAVVRLSGRRAIEIADAVFSPKSGVPPSRQASHTVRIGWAVDPSGGRRIDEALALVMRGPRSYTGEDTVELSSHGGRLAVRKILDACVRAGARLAEPGEFTRRAYLNGRMDLAQAEAVADLIRARSDRAYEAAQSQFLGGLSRFVGRMRDELARILSHIEAAIDFPDDRIDPMQSRSIREALGALHTDCDRLIGEARAGAVARDGLKAVIAGPPNAGKSSLMNALVRKERVIVSEEPGTTRDTIEEEVELGGVRIRLVDTAGLAAAASGVEREGVLRSRNEIGSSDIVLCVFDGSRKPEAADIRIWDEFAALNRFLILNKSDLTGPHPRGQVDGRGMSSNSSPTRTWSGVSDAIAVIETSCLDGSGIPDLERKIADFAALKAPGPSEEAWSLSSRHLEHFRKAAGHIAAALAAYDKGLSDEFPASDVRLALDELGRVVGEVVTDDILDLIFSRFCIGK